MKSNKNSKLFKNQMKQMKLVDPVTFFEKNILVLHEIFKHLPATHWLSLKSVSKTWNEYLSFDHLLWRGRIDLSDESINCNKKLLELCMKNIVKTNNPNSTTALPSVQYLALPSCDFAEGDQYIELLSNRNPIGNFNIDELVFNNVSSTTTVGCKPTSLFYRLMKVKKLNITFPLFLPSVEVIFETQQNLEHFTLKYYDSFPQNYIKCRNLSLKWLELYPGTLVGPPMISHFVEACPNLEHFAYYNSEGNNEFPVDIEKFSKAIAKSKLKFLGLGGIWISGNNEARRTRGQVDVQISEGKWPESLETLVIFPFHWKNFSLISGELDNLQHLAIGHYIDIDKFFNHYKVGKRLKSLCIQVPTNERLKIWKHCDNVEHFTLSYITVVGLFSSAINSHIAGIMNHFPKLKTLDVPGIHLNQKMLKILVKKSGLEKMGIQHEPNLKRLAGGKVKVYYNERVNPYATFRGYNLTFFEGVRIEVEE